jgi:cobalt-zinc-cadmium efflux system membrane fusion protein
MKRIFAPLALTLLLVSCGQAKDSMSAEKTPEAAAAATPKAKDRVTLTPQMKQNANIRVEPVVRQALSQSTIYSAVIQPSETRSGAVSSLVGGVVTRMLADIGEPVRKGQAVALINTTELGKYQEQILSAQSKVQAAQSALKLAQGRRELVRQEVKRETYLVQRGISALQDQQQAQAKLSLAEVDVSNAQAQLRQAQVMEQAAKSQLQALGFSVGGTISPTLTLRSPINGVVVTRNIQPGQVVAAGQNLFTIADLREVWVVLQVPQAQASALPNGTPISFTTEAAPGKVFRGRITGRAQDFDPQTRNIGIRATVRSPNQLLKPGLAVLVKAETGGVPVLTVPTKALQQVDQKDVVFVQKGDAYQLREVTLGERTPQRAEITQGLQAGEQVVSDGSFVLKSELLKSSLGGE